MPVIYRSSIDSKTLYHHVTFHNVFHMYISFLTLKIAFGKGNGHVRSSDTLRARTELARRDNIVEELPYGCLGLPVARLPQPRPRLRAAGDLL